MTPTISQPPSAPPSATTDLERWIARSRPAPSRGGLLTLAFLGLLMILVLTPSDSALGSLLRSPLIVLLAGGLMFSSVMHSRRAAMRTRDEIHKVDRIDDQLQRRQWSSALASLRELLDRPMVRPESRMQALMQMSLVLDRQHRFDDAIQLHDYLLNPDPNEPRPDAGTSFSLRVARTLALLKLDQLLDADTAITQLRRDLRKLQEPDALPPTAVDPLAAMLAVVELYRDVKTGHADECVTTFESTRSLIARSLGYHIADASVMASWAMDRLGRSDRAAELYRNATSLITPAELHRRYPETSVLSQRYPATTYPTGYLT